MSNLVLTRIERQRRRSSKEQVVVREPEPEKEVKKCSPISLSELKNILMEEIEGSLIKTEPITPDVSGEKTDRVFGGIEDFVAWLLPVKEKFTPQQLVPLATLIQARDMIFVGCACKQQYRTTQANEYFSTFWTNNRNTDLIPTIMNIGNYKSVTFYTPRAGNFLVFPTPETAAQG